MAKTLSSSVEKVQRALEALGFHHPVMELPASTRTSVEAAQAVGCKVGQIAKSLVFMGKETSRPILVIASGANRVNEQKIAQFASEPVTKADADFVRVQTGFAIGGVPPVGHLRKMEIFIDEDLLQYDVIWAAAGSPHAVFKLSPSDLLRMTGGRVLDIK